MHIKEIYRGFITKEKLESSRGIDLINATDLPRQLFYQGIHFAGVCMLPRYLLYRGMICAELIASDESMPNLCYKHLPQDLL